MLAIWSSDFFLFRFSDLEKVWLARDPITFSVLLASINWSSVLCCDSHMCGNYHSVQYSQRQGWSSTWFLIFEWSCCEFWGV